MHPTPTTSRAPRPEGESFTPRRRAGTPRSLYSHTQHNTQLTLDARGGAIEVCRKHVLFAKSDDEIGSRTTDVSEGGVHVVGVRAIYSRQNNLSLNSSVFQPFTTN